MKADVSRPTIEPVRDVATFRTRVRDLLRELTAAWPNVEEEGVFPRDIIGRLGAEGVLRERWHGGGRGDSMKAWALAEELGRTGVGSVGVGVSLHTETVVSMLARFAGNDHHRELFEGAVDGTLVGCIGASEPAGGSDLMAVHTTATRRPDGWHVRGEKKFVSLGAVADFALVLARVDDDAAAAAPGGGPSLGVFVIPSRDWTVKKVHRKTGLRALDTVWITIDSVVPEEAALGLPGMGLLVLNYGLSFERLSVAAQVVGACRLALGLTTAHAHRRHQFGVPLVEHQAVRLRLARLSSELSVLALAVEKAAADSAAGPVGMREIAGLKVTAARFGEHLLGECMHLFGGPGYLEDETPLSRMWRDARLARLGAGSDEMMWELMSGKLHPDFPAYDASVDLGTGDRLPAHPAPDPPDHDASFAASVRHLLAELVAGSPNIEEEALFPREVVARLGSEGIFRRRWQGAGRGDVFSAWELFVALGGCGRVSIGMGITVHAETVTAMLRRFGTTDLHRERLEAALAGAEIGCIAASEPGGGSDMSAVTTSAVREGAGWRLRGEKKFVTLGAVADFALVFARIDGEGANGDAPRHGMFVVPASGWEVKKLHRKTGTRGADTAWITVDTMVPEDALLGQPGMGMLVLQYGLTHERFAIASQVVGACEYALGVTVAHTHRRHQFGVPLIEHQAVRMRLAQLASELAVLRLGMEQAVERLSRGALTMREVAGLKATASRFGDQFLNECMHLFGGPGYLEDETPLSRLWRDVRLARVVAGGDELMWEMAAGMLVPDFGAYDARVHLDG